MREYQESVTNAYGQTDRRTNGRTDRRRTK